MVAVPCEAEGEARGVGVGIGKDAVVRGTTLDIRDTFPAESVEVMAV